MNGFGKDRLSRTDRYEKYEKKIQRAASTWALICRHILVSVLIAAATLALLVFLHCIPGMTVKPLTLESDTIPYGETFGGYSLKVWQATPRLEFASADEDDWSTEPPHDIGDYRVRAVVKRLFGHEKAGVERHFSIVPCERTVTAAEKTLLYGTEPTGRIDLVTGDVLAACDFTFSSWTVETEVTAVLSSVRIVNAEGRDVTDSYRLTASPCAMTFMRRDLGVLTADASWCYDGYAHSAEEFEIVSGDLAYEDTVSAVFCEVTDADVYYNTADFTVFNKNGTDVTALYSVNVQKGKITVEPLPIVIGTASAEKIYDRSELWCSEWFFMEGTRTADHDDVEASFGGIVEPALHAGSYSNPCKIKIVRDGRDVTSNYRITYHWGTLTVNPRPITFSSQDLEKVYDDTPFANGAVTISEGSLVEGDVFSYNFTTAAKNFRDVGTAVNEFQAQVFSSINAPGITLDNQTMGRDYAITYAPGTLTITPRPITVYSSSETKEYDGKPLYSKVDHVDNLLAGASLTRYDGASLVRAGKCEASLEVSVFVKNRNVTSNYDITYRFGTLEITRHPITLSVISRSKEYDGTALVPEECLFISDLTRTLITEWNTVEVELTGSQLTAGRSESGISSFRIFDLSGEDVTDCFKVSAACGGYLDVLQRNVYVLTPSFRKIYDGTPLVAPTELTIHDQTIVPGESCKFTLTGSLTDPGRVTVKPRNIRFYNANGVDVTSSYHVVEIADGSLTVEQIPLTIRTQTAQKKYDGTALTAKTAWISQGQLLPGHKLTYTVTGYVRGKGTSENSISGIRIRDERGIDVTNRYAISVSCGTLTIY